MAVHQATDIVKLLILIESIVVVYGGVNLEMISNYSIIGLLPEHLSGLEPLDFGKFSKRHSVRYLNHFQHFYES